MLITCSLSLFTCKPVNIFAAVASLELIFITHLLWYFANLQAAFVARRSFTMQITQLSVSVSVSVLQILQALFCSLSEFPPPSLNLSVAVNILLCDILTQAFFSFEIDLHELFFFCKVLKFLWPAPFVFFHHLSVLFVCVCVCVCICFLGDPRLVLFK